MASYEEEEKVLLVFAGGAVNSGYLVLRYRRASPGEGAPCASKDKRYVRHQQ